MNSDYDITLHSDESSASDSARDHFLDSIGLGEKEGDENGEMEVGVVASDPEDSSHETLDDETLDEGVVLSSQPEGFELPADQSASAGERPVSYSPGSSSEHTRTGTISIKPDDRVPSSGGMTGKAEVIPDENTDHEKLLALECPECRGELALRRSHLGIEGLCVWCHAPIVAAESPRDSLVRVFPVLGRIAKPLAAPADSCLAPAVIEDGAREATAETERLEFDLPSEITDPTALMAMDDPATEDLGDAIPTESKEEPSPLDLDALYATSGFGQPAAHTDAPPTGLGQMMAASIAPTPPEAPAFSVATPWGAPAQPTTDPTPTGPLAPTEPETETNDEGPVSLSDDFAASFHTSGFDTSGFGSATAPSELGNFTAPGQSNPAPDAAIPPTNDLAADFQTSRFGGPEPAPASEATKSAETAETAADVDFATALASAGFGSPALSPEPENPAVCPSPETPAPMVETPGFTFQNAPVSELIFGDDTTEEKRSSAILGQDFSTENTSEDKAEFGFFPGLSKAETTSGGWGISEPIGTSSPDDAPVPLALEATFPQGAGAVPGSFVDDSTPSPEPPVSFFSEVAPRPAFPAMPRMSSAAPGLAGDPSTPAMPPLLQTQESTFSSITNPIGTAAPNVVSEPLGSKPPPKVRKGFLVLMAVIVGFAAGAALASFVLPVDEYVQTARAIMEKKLNPEATYPQPSILPIIAEETNPSAPLQNP